MPTEIALSLLDKRVPRFRHRFVHTKIGDAQYKADG
jgi:hypothetical protein